MRTRKLFLVPLLVCAVTVLLGCSSESKKTGKTGASGKVEYSWGVLNATESASIEKVYDASLKAVEELKLPIIQKGVDLMSGKIITRDVEDKKIIITLTAATGGMTKISIKVGTLGDEEKSKLIYEQIKKKM
jgi:hypothetical protein